MLHFGAFITIRSNHYSWSLAHWGDMALGASDPLKYALDRTVRNVFRYYEPHVAHECDRRTDRQNRL